MKEKYPQQLTEFDSLDLDLESNYLVEFDVEAPSTIVQPKIERFLSDEENPDSKSFQQVESQSTDNSDL
jgi:hypothetical protein